MSPGILIDTNVYAAFKRNHPAVVDELQRATEVVVCPVVLGELLGGFAFGSRERENLRELDEFMAAPRVRLLNVTDRTSVFYARINGALGGRHARFPPTTCGSRHPPWNTASRCSVSIVTSVRSTDWVSRLL